MSAFEAEIFCRSAASWSQLAALSQLRSDLPGVLLCQQVYQRQSQSYLYRDREGNPALYRPPTEAAAEVGDPSQVSDRVSARADLTWEIEMPMMKWSGSSVQRLKGDTQQYFSLKDAMSGRFLVQQDDGSIIFSDNDDTPMAHWELQAFDRDTSFFKFNHTTFLIQNRATKKILHRKDRAKAVEDDTRSQGKHKSKRSKEPEGEEPDDLSDDVPKIDDDVELFDLAAIDESRVHQDDLFVCRALPKDWLADFQDLQHNIIKLVRFEEQVRKAIDARKSRGLKIKDAGKDTEEWVGKNGDNNADIKDLVRIYLRRNLDMNIEAPVMSVLVNILMTISVASDENVLTRDGLINAGLQNMLSEFRIIPLVLNTVRTVMELVPRTDIVKLTFGPELLHFVRCSFRVLRMMAKGNEMTSRVLYGELDGLVYQLGFPFSVADVISEIFAGTFDLIRKCEKSFIEKIWNLAKEQREPRYINFLCVLLEHEGRAIKFNQDSIISIVSKDFPPNFFGTDWRATEKEVDMVQNPDKYEVRIIEEASASVEAREKKVKEFFFHVSFTRMAGLLCSGRHRESVDFFLRQSQFGFSYKEVLANLTIAGPSQSRESYALLMLKLFVDREPFELCAPVQKTRILPTIAIDGLELEAPKRVDPYEDLDGVEKPTRNFSDLKDTILTILSENEGQIDRTQVEGNKFVCAVLDLAQQLLVCGVYDDAFDETQHSQGVLLLGPEGIALGTALLPLLDGRQDGASNGAATGLADHTERFILNHENSTVMFMKRRILDVINTLFAMRASTRVAVLLETFYQDALLPASPKSVKRTHSWDRSPKKIDEKTAFDEKAAMRQSQAFTKFSNPLSLDGDDPIVEDPTWVQGDPAGQDDDDDEDPTDMQWSVSPKSFDTDTAEAPKKKKKVKKNKSKNQSWGDLSPKSQGSNQDKMAQHALKRVQEIRVFPADDDERLTDILVDILRYTVDPKLGFSGFHTLIYYLSQNYAFSKTLRDIVVLGTDVEAVTFLRAGMAMSEFRRLRKWLHRPDDCRQCIAIVEGELTEYCSTKHGQNMLRNLNFEEYSSRVMLMRLGTPLFEELMRKTLTLVEKFCEGNQENQAVMATHMDTIFKRLLWDENYVDAAAHCIRSVVSDNKGLSLMLGSQLVDLVAELSRLYGRKLSLMNLLEKLLFVDGKPLVEMQIQVCKGAMMSKDMLEVSAQLDENEWGKGPGRDRIGMLATIFNYDEATAKSAEKELFRRCMCEAEYYATSLIILAECASGKNPTTELLCASILPFSVCVTRLHEIFDHPELQRTEEDITGIKNCTVCFFRDVFIDTNSTHILKTLQRPNNGLWTLDESTHAKFANPIALSIIADLDELEDPADAQGKCKITANDRRYIFEQALMFFIQYAEVMPFGDISADETEVVTKTYQKVGAIMDVALRPHYTFWTEKEKNVLEQLKNVSDLWLSHQRVDNIEKMLPPAIGDEVKAPHVEQWASIVESLVETMKIRNIKGTNRVVGIGIMRVAKALWQVVPSSDVTGEDHHHHHNPDQVHFASYLVEPLNIELDKMVATSDLGTVPKLLTMLDAARGIPYALSDHTDSDDKIHASEISFEAFVQVAPLDCTMNPDVARVQTAMMRQGWGLLCLKILDQEVFAPLHLCSLRLLLAITGGGQRQGNIDAQNVLLSQISVTPREICAGAMRRLLRESINDLKLQRKLEAEREEAKQQNVKFDESLVVEQTGHATETLTVMMNMCLGNHRGMQDYILRQPGHLRDLNLLADVVAYLNQVERDIKTYVEHWTAEGDTGDVPVLEQCFAGLRILIAVCGGPNRDAQVAVCNTEIMSIINRMMEYSKYTHHDVLASGENSPRRKLVAQIGRLVVTLLEGEPPADVVTAIRRGLNWVAWGEQLRILRKVMEDGTIPSDDKFKGQVVPVDDRHAAWISGDAFKLMTVVDKTTYGAQALLREEDHLAGHVDWNPTIEPLIPDVKTLEYFHGRLGEVEIVREGQLERLFFWMPDLYMDKDKRKEVETTVLQTMDTASRENDDDKLRDFVDGCLNAVNLILQEEQCQNDRMIRLHEWITNFSAGDSVLYFSFLTSLVCIVSYVPAGQGDPLSDGRSLHKETYMRWNNYLLEDDLPEMWIIYLVFSTVHLFVCLLAFYHFTTVQVPVMLKARGREQRKQHMKRETGHDAEHQEFLRHTIHAYGFSAGIASEKVLKALFSHYGVVSGVSVVEVVGAVNSWAIINFSSDSAVEKILDECRQNDQIIHGTDDYFILVGSKKKKELKILVRPVDDEYLAATGGYLGKLVGELEYDLTTSADTSVGYIAASNLQAIVNNLPHFGPKIPIQAMYILRYNKDFWEAIFDIIFSATGFFTSPLCLSWHLYRVKNFQGANIVLQSFVSNFSRIATTLLLALLLMYYFAILGVLMFQGDHTADKTLGDHKPCDNLLSCFVSYSMVGLTQEGLGKWLELVTIPQEFDDLPTMDTGRIVWEIMFMLMTSCMIIAIITGIICDTFGELRSQQDNAAAYRSNTCFITGISYSQVMPEKSTDPMQYAFMLLYLSSRKSKYLTPVEQFVWDDINHGQIDWMPKGRCFSLQENQQEEQVMEQAVLDMKVMLTDVNSRLGMLETAQNDIKTELGALHQEIANEDTPMDA